MTIYSSQNTQNEEKKEGDLLQSLTVQVEVSDEPVEETQHPPAQATHRLYTRRRICLQLLLLLLMIAGLSICIFGSLHLWKWNSYQRYSGWCGVKYSPDGQSDFYLDEEVQVDPQQSVEVLTVPEFDDNDAAIFVHDFYRNISLIRVENDALCYIMPLDRSRIPEPDSFLSILLALSERRFLIEADRVQQLYRVAHPPVPADIIDQSYGEYIGSLCTNFTTYTLRRLEGVAVPTTTTTQNSFSRKFGMFAGGSLINYEIIEIGF